MPDRTPDVIIGEQARRVPITEYRQGYYWTCQHCGWLGVNHLSLNMALQEAGRHMDERHPQEACPLVERRDLTNQTGEDR